MTPTLLLLALGFVTTARAGIIDSNLAKTLAEGGTKDVIFEFPSITESVFTDPAVTKLTGKAKHTKAVEMLRAKANEHHEPIKKTLKSLGFGEDKIDSLWISNSIRVKGASLGPLQAVAALPGNFLIREPYTAKAFPYVEKEVRRSFVGVRQSGSAPQWGVAKINAPTVWQTGILGQGVVVGIIDSGVNGQHEALSSNYLNAGSASWLDAFDEYQEPTDPNGHGTHCAGTILGTTNGIGVAPQAKWMACRGLDAEGSGDETTLGKCGQFMACPFNNSGTCEGMPHVVSNSWGGAGGRTWYNRIINTWRSLGIIPVFAIGNNGLFGCGSVGSPGDQPNLISVGATDINDTIAYFSSRGPNYNLKNQPQVSAPGVAILSADASNTNGYIEHDGTSMATPHVAGAVALLLSQNPNMKYDDIYQALTTTAYRPRLGLFDYLCQAFSLFQQWPNNIYGYGRIDVAKAAGL
jgi:subtilisin family serine protease